VELTSGLRFYSLGIVVETKKDGSDVILVNPIEHLGMAGNGLISETKNDRKNKLPDKDGVESHAKVSSSDYVKARWRSIGSSNRMSAPDVVANETVLILKYGDVDEYFWTSLGNEPGIRRKEDVLYSICNLPDGFAVFDKKTSYWFQWSTKQQFLTLRTNKNSGEYTGYTLHIDTKKGLLVIEDDKGNGISIDSPTDTLSINAKNIKLDASVSLTLNGKTLNVGNVKEAAPSGTRPAIVPASSLRDLDDLRGLDGCRGKGKYLNGDNSWDRTTGVVNIAAKTSYSIKVPQGKEIFEIWSFNSNSSTHSANSYAVNATSYSQSSNGITINASSTTNNSASYTLNSPSTNVMLK
jgi:hypothetical protein